MSAANIIAPAQRSLYRRRKLINAVAIILACAAALFFF